MVKEEEADLVECVFLSSKVVETGEFFREIYSLETGPFQNIEKIYGGERDGSKNQIKKNGTEEGSFL